MRWSAEVDPSVPGHVAVEGQAGEARDEPCEGDGGLQAGERRAEAVMRPGAEGDVVARVVAAEPDFGGVDAPEELVAVGRAEAGHDEGTGWDDGVPDRDPFDGDPPAGLHGAVVAQQVLDGVRGYGWGAAQQRELT